MFELLKWVHIISSTVLFGTGLGTAFHMWMAYRSGSVAGLRSAAGITVLADWLFTLPSGLVQPASGILLAIEGGWSLWDSWLLAAYVLYALALACWVPVVVLQLRVKSRLASIANAAGDFPADIRRSMRIWFWLGWPAFAALLGVFWLMIAKPGF